MTLKEPSGVELAASDIDPLLLHLADHSAKRRLALAGPLHRLDRLRILARVEDGNVIPADQAPEPLPRRIVSEASSGIHMVGVGVFHGSVFAARMRASSCRVTVILIVNVRRAARHGSR